MPENSSLIENINALAQRIGENDRYLARIFIQCIGDVARATDRLTQLEAWAQTNGYTLPDETTNGE